MQPAELQRELARLAALAASARRSIEELGEVVKGLEQSIEELGSQTAVEPTSTPGVVQAEVASK